MAVRDALAVEVQVVFDGIVAHKAFQFTDGDRLKLLAHHAAALALALLRAHTAAYGRQSRVAADDAGSTLKVAFGYTGDKAGNVHIDGAMGHTLRALAVEATLGLHDGHIRRIAQTDLIEVVGADFRLLFRARHTLFLVEGLFRDAADVALVAFGLLFSFELLAGLHIIIHGLTLHGAVEINVFTQELGTIDAGELGLSTDAHAAGTAHTRAVNHNRVERHRATDAQLLAGFRGKLHHNHRADGHSLIIDFTAGH